MKKQSTKLLSIILLTVLFIITSCERAEEHGNHSHENRLVFEKVNLDQIPLFERKFKTDNDTYKSRISGNKSGNDTINYFDLIVPENINSELYDQANNLHYYTFALNLKEKKQLSNLVVKETLEGNEYYVCIFKPANIEEWVESITNYNMVGTGQLDTEIFKIELQVSYSDKIKRSCWTGVTSWRCPYNAHTIGEGNWLSCETFNAGGGGLSGWTSSITYLEIPCAEDGGGSSSGTGNGSGTGSSTGGSSSGGGGTSGSNVPVTINVQPNAPNKLVVFVSNLSPEQKAWWSNTSNIANKIPMMAFLTANNHSVESEDFVEEMITLASTETNQQDVNKLINLTLLIEKSGSNFFTQEFELSLDPYVDLNIATLQADHFPGLTVMEIYYNYRRLRQLNPEWSKGKCFWHASRNIVHLSLDAFGLIPVGGEIADIANGVLYTLDGDTVNATLSYVSAVPIAGWATVGVKYSLKVVNTAYDVSTKVKLVWKVLPDGKIFFGSNSHCRSTLRKVLGLGIGNANQAHHIIPLNLQTNEVVQRAAKSGSAFHMNEALNGIPLSTAVHNGSHSHYDTLIRNKLMAFLNANPNATPLQCYNKLMEIIQQIRTAIQNNPGVPINQLNF